MSDEVIGDIEPDDAFDPDDDTVNWSQVEELEAQMMAIDAIEDPDEQTAAAVRWAAELEGGPSSG